MDKLNAMTTFVRIVDRGTMTGAARSLGTSLPSVVRTLAALERFLGVRLLNRTTRRIQLTEEGRVYLERCRRIVEEVEEADRSMSARRATPSGNVAVTAPVLFGRMHVAPIVAGFLAEHPEVRVELMLQDRIVNLLEENLDVAVRIGPLADSSLVAVPVGHVRRIVCASPRLLRRTGGPKHPSDLAGRPCIGFTGLGGEEWSFRADGRAIAVRVKGPLSSNHADVALDACAGGLGYGRFLSYQAMPLVKRGKLRIVLAGFEPPPIPVSIVVPHARLLPVRVRAFVDWSAARLRRALAPA
ncbi:MAG: LysR family transcriptional regulator [Candidatus Binatia bacterium]